MVVITQALQPGYGSQPPLYNWLQIAAFSVFGFGAPAIVILHFVLLWAVYVLVFLSARIVLDDEVKAAAVSLGLFAIPQIGWEALHSHTHTLLSLTLAAATLLAMLRVLERGRWLDYLVLGICFALGALAKYSFIPFAAALLIAAATIPGLRARVVSWRMAAAIVLALVLLAPHLDWVRAHIAETLSRTSKFKIDDDAGLFAAWRAASPRWSPASPATWGCRSGYSPWLPFCRSARRMTPAPSRPARPGLPHGRAFVLRVLLIALGIVLVAVLVTRATEVKERWLQPVLFLLPLALMILVEPRLNRFRERLLIALSAAIGVIFMVGLAVVYLLPDLHGGPFRASAPSARSPRTSAISASRTAMCSPRSHYIAGNLKLHLPERHGRRARVRPVAGRRGREVRAGAACLVRTARPAAQGAPRRCSTDSAGLTPSATRRPTRLSGPL